LVDIDDTDFGRVADQFEGAEDAWFAHDAGAVAFNGFGAVFSFKIGCIGQANIE
jgi:hypothetical protein